MENKSKFIIVLHDAKKAGKHYDLRFQIPNSKLWASFAVRKGVPLEYGKKVLAVKTHIHTEKDALMLGKLSSGYGAGHFTKYDDGEVLIKKYTSAHIILLFKGGKVKGIYHLVSTGNVKTSKFKDNHYILFKGKTQMENTIKKYLKVINEEMTFDRLKRGFMNTHHSVPEIKVGKHNHIPDDDFCQLELEMGIKVEYEHTDDYEIAKAIAKDHLAEIPGTGNRDGYYSRLKKMEEEAGVIEEE